MGAFLAIFLPLAEKYGPGLYADVLAAFQKNGWTVAQIDAVFSKALPYDQLGINPNAPVQPETPTPVTPTTPPTA